MADAGHALDWLRAHATAATLAGMARYAIPQDNALGVSMADMKKLAKEMGRDHALATALWDSGIYEARTVACLVEEPALVTGAQMERWCKAFDSWAIVDTACFNLFDRVAPRWDKLQPWAAKQGEFQKRAGFALLWALALHDRQADDAQFRAGLDLIDAHAGDGRNFVKKAVAMALGAVGRRNAGLAKASLALATRLAASDDPARRWIGKDARKALAARG